MASRSMIFHSWMANVDWLPSCVSACISSIYLFEVSFYVYLLLKQLLANLDGLFPLSIIETQIFQRLNLMPLLPHSSTRNLDLRNPLPYPSLIQSPVGWPLTLAAILQAQFRSLLCYGAEIVEAIDVVNVCGKGHEMNGFARTLFLVRLVYPSVHFLLGRWGQSAGPDSCDDGALRFGDGEGDDALRNAEEREGRVRSVYDVLPEVGGVTSVGDDNGGL